LIGNRIYNDIRTGARSINYIKHPVQSPPSVIYIINFGAIKLMVNNPLPIYVPEGLNNKANERPSVVTIEVEEFSLLQYRL
jgi:hypothetical protein